MITLFRANDVADLDSLQTSMREHIRKLPRHLSFIGEPRTIIRYELPCEEINILGWMHNNQLETDKLYFSDRSGLFETGGIGTCDVICGDSAPDHKEIIESMRERLSADNPNLRYYGGFNFNEKKSEEPWKPLGSYRFIIPLFEFYKNEDNCLFAFNIAVSDVKDERISQILQDFDKLNFQNTTEYRKVPEVMQRADIPDQNQWRETFQSMFVQEKNRFEKIVLARKTDFSFDMELRPMALLKHLKDMSPNCFHFCLQTKNNYGFLGASPERLFKRLGDQIQTEALAGTAPRGSTEEEDEQEAQRLLSSKKNKTEHKFVVDDLAVKLTSLCKKFEKDERAGLLKLDNSQHLKTSFTGTLKEGVEDYAILRELHPTPAVAGIPKEQALAAIEEAESFNRGWYASPIGYVGYDEAEFAVAIRSGLVQKNILSLFAGAGIVEGSNEDEEWNEIEEKIGSFIKVFDR